MGKLQDKVAIVTGAASGMGATTAALFAAEGAKVVLCDLNREQGEAVAARIGGEAIFRYLDIRDDDGWAALVAELRERFGRIDILLNNAAMVGMWPIEEMDVERARAVVDTNVFGALLGAKNVAGIMRRAGRGVIINVSSLTGVIGMNGLSAYSASKWAVRGITRSLALEFGPSGIRVCTIVPGGVNTPMNNPGTATLEQLNKGYKHVPLQRIGEPIEVARASLFLASDDASYITGAELMVDGGDAAGYYQPGLPGAPAGFVLGGIG
ncbi:MAG: putative short chain dehydrogenase [Rhodospirillales bacterium]|nr:putative short chain dehydrogenase [Rhodospirillales bacterium]